MELDKLQALSPFLISQIPVKGSERQMSGLPSDLQNKAI